ncbi:hypothetical protein Goklo_028842, partial [Gossypium klotzschianum]|nr:hypothetical protein [Gossypium klotzschianum]
IFLFVIFTTKDYSSQTQTIACIWEKKFYIERGAMPWERFVEANKNLYENDKVLKWDDLGSLTAFQEVKQRF